MWVAGPSDTFSRFLGTFPVALSRRSVGWFVAKSATYQPIVERTIHVVATSIDGTKAALTAAKRAAQQRGARVVLLVPTVDSPDTPAEQFADATNWLVARYQKVARDIGQPVQVRISAGQNAAKAVALLSPVNGVVFMGGPVQWFWPSAEERIAAALRRTGRDVVFVGCNR